MKSVFEKTNKERLNIFSIEEDGIMIYDARTENTHLLNETAAYLYNLLEKPLNLDEIVELFKFKYTFVENSIDELEDDIMQMIDELSARELIIMRREEQ